MGAPPYSVGGALAYGGPPAVAASGAQLCKDYMHGRCARGGGCRFSHEGLPELNVDQPICKDFNNGLCTRGAGCRYKHDMEPPGSKPTGGVCVMQTVAPHGYDQQQRRQQAAAQYQAAYGAYYGSGAGSYGTYGYPGYRYGGGY